MKITPGIYEVAAPIQFERGAQLVGDANPRATMPTRAEMCADLACAMGWTNIRWHSPFEVSAKPVDGAFAIAGTNPAGEHFCEIPDPSTNAADKDALVAWLAQDNARWTAFYRILEDALKIPEGETRAWRAMWLLTAPLEAIAEAAWRAIQFDS